MPIKQSYRPGYAARRFVHHKRVDFAVWLQNRKVEKAFYDPFLEGGTPSRMSVWMGHRATPWIIGGFAMVAAAIAVALALRGHFEMEKFALEALPSAPARVNAPVAPPAPTPAAPAAMIPSPAPVPPIAPKAEAAPAPEAPPPAAASLPAVAAPQPATWTLPMKYNALVACKKDRTLYVYAHEGKDWRKVAAFPMAFGRKAGDKADAGDWRTPEGRYWINGMYPGPIKGPLYGPLVFTLNYPTPRDQADGKTGQGIWIHGVEEGKRPTYTHGCLSLANDDMLALSSYVDIGTPVLIIPDSLNADPARQMDEADMRSEYPALMAAFGRRNHEDTLARDKALKWAKTFVEREAKAHPQLAEDNLSVSEKEAILAGLAKWREDWCRRDIASYGSHYAAEFKDKEGRDKKTFLDRKGRIFAVKDRIGMEMEKPQIEAEGYGRVKVSFRQVYVAEGSDGVQRSSSMKSLRMEQGPGGWLIINE
jgi:murein L,D-transpeptidase YafK